MHKLITAAIIGLWLPLAALAPKAAACVLDEGEYTGTPELNYECPSWGIFWTVDKWTFTDLGAGQIKVTTSPTVFPELTGTINCGDSTFVAVRIVADGFCNVSYTLAGRFTSSTHWVGSFSVQYTGYCETCPASNNAVEGSMGTVSVPASTPPRASLAIHPNPLHDGTAITLRLNERQHVLVDVFDMKGRRVGTLNDSELSEGTHAFRWNRKTDAGDRVPAGLYLVRAQVGRERLTAKAIVVN